MAKTCGSVAILALAFFISALILQHTQIVSAQSPSFSSDPVPGGMCGCMSCNCYPLNQTVADASGRNTSASNSILTSQQLALVDGGAGNTPTVTKPAANSSGSPDDRQAANDAAKAAATKTSTSASTGSSNTSSTKAPNSSGSPDDRQAANDAAKAAATKTTTTNTSATTKTTTSASNSSSNTSSSNNSSNNSNNNSKPSNPNTSSTKAPNSSGSPDDRQAANDAAKATAKPAANSSGSPDDRQAANDAAKANGGTGSSQSSNAATGKSNDSYLYSSNIYNTAPVFTTPTTKSSSLSPQTSTPGKNNTFVQPIMRIGTSFTQEEAIQQAKAHPNDKGVIYEFKTISGTGYVDSSGNVIPNLTPQTSKPTGAPTSQNTAVQKAVGRIYQTPQEALRDAKGFKNDAGVYYGYPADPSNPSKSTEYFDSNGNHVINARNLGI